MGHCLGLATSTATTMNTFLFFSTLIAYCSASTTVVGNAATYLVRAPAHDSASIEHHRLGGNFAYSTAEAHAYAEVIPQISTLTHPVAETTPTHQPAPIVKTHHVAQPIFKNVPTYGTQQITGPVRTHQTVHQPIVHETRTHTVQAVSQAVATPVHAVAHAPVAVAHAAPVAVAHAAPVAHAAYAHAPIAHAAFAHAPVAVAAAPAVVA